jgi:signal peptidase II
MRWLTWAALISFVIDQASKYMVIHVMELWRLRAIDVLPPLLNFRYGENRGINFGLFDGGSEASRWILVAVALVISVGVLIWASRTAMSRSAHVAAGLLVGGAIANVLDRLVYGYVLDFLNVSCCGIENPFVFNLADVFIFAGAIGLVFLAPDGKASAKKGQ